MRLLPRIPSPNLAFWISPSHVPDVRRPPKPVSYTCRSLHPGPLPTISPFGYPEAAQTSVAILPPVPYVISSMPSCPNRMAHDECMPVSGDGHRPAWPSGRPRAAAGGR